MKIGEVARRAGVTPRLVRYYEQQGLLEASRESNGYRSYDEEHVERVQRVASLIRSGVPTRLIKVLLDAEAAPPDEACPRAVAELLAAELAGLDDRIACLSRSRDTIRDYLARTEVLADSAP
ncbi:MerR family transcriptional regulator [Antribacter gilvus]|uniref:MerR family transcriptional regulator n=1 Tax=Antribacter gilvus TaxID=2304675 RepID=UPI000F77EE1C|nr:MerR family transcriptional regulator [Antribacter gilvus]